jgi:hypothetical protein
MTITTAPPTAVRIEPAYPDPDAVVAVIRAVGEYWPLARYAASPEEMVATGGDPNTAMYVPPWFRRDFALFGEALVPGAGLILDNGRFVDAAHRVFGADAVVRPSTVYVNVMLPSVAPFVPHLDVPAFRGFTRADHPLWLMKVMIDAGLFEPSVAGFELVGLPKSHRDGPTLLNVLRVLDLPQAVALAAPRPVTLRAVNKADWEWPLKLQQAVGGKWLTVAD